MAAKAKSYKPGEIIVMQGESVPFFLYLAKGSVEILSAAQEYSGLNSKIILEHSNRVNLISEASFILGISGKTVRAVDACDVQMFQAPEGFSRFVKEEPGTAVTLLAHLFRRVEMANADLGKLLKLYQNICVVGDNLSIMSKEVSAGELPERISSRADILNETFRKSGGALPKQFDPQFLLTDRSVSLKKKYQLPGDPLESVLEKSLYDFFKRFARVDRNISAHLAKADPEIAAYMFERVSLYLSKIFDKVSLLYESINDEMDMLYGAEDSWSRFLGDYGAFADWERSGKLAPDFPKNFTALSSKIYSMYGVFSGKDITSKFPGFGMLRAFLQKSNAPKAPAASGSGASTMRPDSPAADSNIVRLYANSLQQIFSYAVAPNDFCAQMTKLINEFMKYDNPFAPDDDQRKTRRQITKLYWQLYSQVYIRSLSEKNIPAPARLLLMFGFLDERLVDPDQLEPLHRLAQMNQPTEYPIFYEGEFLQKIYSAEEPPSLNEVGLTYEKQLREESKSSAPEQTDIDDPLKKVDYEIQNRLQSTVGICSGSRSTAFPILTSNFIKGNPEAFLSSKKKVQETLKELLSYDYSAFYRETVTKLNEPVIMEEEILPYIVLLPSFGTKTMMWQEIVGTNKRSRARIMVPIFFMGDLRRSLAHSIASFRWEINRSLQGAMWADPVEGGLTGAYYDYVQFFRKNSKLSTEAKEKLHERIKGVRNNMKELFCEDYIVWQLFEREGTMKLNGVVRDIFYRFIPFKKEIRDNLETMPAFVELAQKFKNVRARKYREYDNKFKKYRDAEGNLPEMMQKFMDYLRL
jgi:hypothetical protein